MGEAPAVTSEPSSHRKEGGGADLVQLLTSSDATEPSPNGPNGGEALAGPMNGTRSYERSRVEAITRN